MLNILKQTLSPAKKRRLKSFYHKSKKKIINIAYPYSYDELVKALIDLGIHAGDIMMVHSSFSPFTGFQGTPQDVIKAFKHVIGPEEGTLLMVSLPYTSSTYKYLKKTKVFYIHKNISKMGIISEIFRRQRDVVRSLHPTHPVLAFGPLANWFVEAHETCLYPCGPGSPFEKLAQKDGKVLFFNVSFNTFTFIHYIEHLIQEKIPFPLYAEEVFNVTVFDAKGGETKVKTKAFSSEAVQKRRPEILEKRMVATGKIKTRRIGKTNLSLVKVRDAISCVNDMTKKGEFFYDLK